MAAAEPKKIEKETEKKVAAPKAEPVNSIVKEEKAKPEEKKAEKKAEEKKPEEKKEKVYQSLSATDRETADLYAELYETDREQVAKIQAETKDWEQTGRKLEQDFFTIPENTKYQMEQEGYSLDDLEQAEKLSVKTGRKAIELAKEKGKTSENRQWSDVVKDSEILSTEEQLGLSNEQIQQLKDKSLSKEERIEVAVLLLNETYSFGEVLKELDAGKTVEELEK